MRTEVLTVPVGGTNIQVTMRGAGDPLVLVHGLSGSTAWWVRNVDALSQGYRVYLIDLPGFGSMRRYANEFSVAGSPDWIAEVLSALGLNSVALIGHSMGGLIAALFAARYPQRVSKLVLAAPAIALLHKSVLPLLLPLLRDAMYMQPAFFPTLVRDAARAGPKTLIRAAREILTIDTHEELANISAPCLLLFGERDPLVPATISDAVHTAIRNSSVLLLPRASHVLMYDRPDLFNEAVLHFLSRPIGSRIDTA